MLTIFGNGTDTVSWTPEPTRRGTFSILSSCILTTLLCVWTAVHLNIPEYEDLDRPWYRKRQLWRKVKWLLIALLAPEMVAYTAWVQYRIAKQILHQFRSKSGQSPAASWFRTFLQKHRSNAEYAPQELQSPAGANPRLELKHPWSMVHAYYVLMGGFALDASEDPQPFLPGGRKRQTLTCQGIECLLQLRPQLFPDISGTQIRDKSKASDLTKMIVCTQASWFCLQCVSRMVQSLPISLLELNSLGHSICALLIYLLWWSKPLDIEEPTLIGGDEGIRLLAFMYMVDDRESNRVIVKRHPPLPSRGDVQAEPADGGQSQCSPASVSSRSPISQSIMGAQPETRSSSTDSSKPDENINVRITPIVMDLPQDHIGSLEVSYAPTHLRKGEELLSTGLVYDPQWPDPPDVLGMSPGDVKRWTLAAELCRETALRTGWDRLNCFFDYRYLVDDRSRNWPLMGLASLYAYPIYPIHFRSRLFAVNTAGILYGGLHALAWTAPFSSPTQCLLWRMSSLVIVAFGPLTILFLLWQRLWEPWWKRYGYHIRDILIDLYNSLSLRFEFLDPILRFLRPLFWGNRLFRPDVRLTVSYLALLVYVLARAYLIVECFISLSNSPVGIYDVPAWSSYFPHIS